VRGKEGLAVAFACCTRPAASIASSGSLQAVFRVGDGRTFSRQGGARRLIPGRALGVVWDVLQWRLHKSLILHAFAAR
jgi:hypothetical protein